VDSAEHPEAHARTLGRLLFWDSARSHKRQEHCEVADQGDIQVLNSLRRRAL
jgi:hypothetical protein